MERLREILETIRKQLARLTASQKLLIGSIAVIAVMGLFLAAQYAGKPKLVELLPGVAPAEQARALSALRVANIQVKDVDGKAMVPPGTEQQALALLQEQGQLPDDTSILFRHIIEKSSWQNSRTQNEQLFQIALQNELGRVISNFKDIKSATVILDVPQPVGLGAAVRRPTGSVTVFMESGRSLEQPTVDAIASLVSGARAGLPLENVRVIDGSTGRQRQASSPDDVSSSHYREHAAAVEEQKRRQLMELLSYIPGVIVAVTAEVDVSRVNTQSTRYASPDEGGTVSLLAKETKKSVTNNSTTPSAEPGIRSNQAVDISRGPGGAGMRSEQKDTETAMENRVGSEVQQVIDPRGMPTRLAASVMVPEGFIAAVLRRSKGAGGGGQDDAVPTEQEIRDKFAEFEASIRASLLPHLKTGRTEGEVSVSLIPLELPQAAATSQAGLFGTGGGGVLAFGGSGGLVEKAVLGVLAVVALGLMVSLVRKNAKPIKLPSPQEIVGVPPTLETGGSVVGEADETETAMAGIEVEEDSVRVQKMLEQLGEMVQTDPASSTRVLNRWLQTDR